MKRGGVTAPRIGRHYNGQELRCVYGTKAEAKKERNVLEILRDRIPAQHRPRIHQSRVLLHERFQLVNLAFTQHPEATDALFFVKDWTSCERRMKSVAKKMSFLYLFVRYDLESTHCPNPHSITRMAPFSS